MALWPSVHIIALKDPICSIDVGGITQTSVILIVELTSVLDGPIRTHLHHDIRALCFPFRRGEFLELEDQNFPFNVEFRAPISSNRDAFNAVPRLVNTLALSAGASRISNWSSKTRGAAVPPSPPHLNYLGVFRI